MKTVQQKISVLLISVILISFLPPARAAASYEIPGLYQVQVDSGSPRTVKTLDYSYENNTYFSLRDLAAAFQGTDKAFSLEITRNTVSLNLGGSYTSVGGENVPWEGSGNPNVSLNRNEFNVNGEKTIYYTMIMKQSSGYYDCFIMAADLGMILDVDISVPEKGVLQIDTQNSFCVLPAALEQAGYFYGVNGVLVGDATTGEIYYQYHSDTAYPLASTTKLMTCLLTLEAIAEGRLSRGDLITVSEEAQALAASGDGVVPLTAGEQIPVQDLLVGTMLPSSNECALTLAEAIAGSEEAFVERMNQKAQELGLLQAIFFNCHGLPSFSADPVPAKRQNHMSAEDMFRMVSYLLRVYPQVTEITSMKTATLESLNLNVRNTNPLLHNMPEAVGMKTGTTNKAGACLVTALACDDGVMEHKLVVVVLGTENSTERGRVSGLLAKYALEVFYHGREEAGEEADRTADKLPSDAEIAVERILQTAKKRTAVLADR